MKLRESYFLFRVVFMHSEANKNDISQCKTHKRSYLLSFDICKTFFFNLKVISDAFSPIFAAANS